MDNNELLRRTREIAQVLSIASAKARSDTSWNWAKTAVLFPESKCTWCGRIIRSNSIWFLQGTRLKVLSSILRVKEGQAEFHIPSHPHNMGGGTLCLGTALDGVHLLSLPINRSDCPTSIEAIPRWLKVYWDHTCDESRQYLINQRYTETLRELDEAR